MDKFFIAEVAEFQPAALLENDFSQVFPKFSLKFETFVSKEHLLIATFEISIVKYILTLILNLLSQVNGPSGYQV